MKQTKQPHQPANQPSPHKNPDWSQNRNVPNQPKPKQPGQEKYHQRTDQ